MAEWRRAWRDGILPSLGVAHLEALREGLRGDDPALMQRVTTSPPPLHCVRDWPPVGACALGYGGWKGGGLATVEEVEEFFARACFDCDERLGEPAGCRHFLNWFDETPRDEVRALLLEEVELALAALGPAGEAGPCGKSF